MAISAIITKIVKDPDATVVDVVYTDNVSFKTQKEYRLVSFNLKAFKQIVRSQIDQFSQVDNVDKLLQVGDFDPSDDSLTPDQQARADYSKNIILFGQMTRAIAAGVKTNADKDYVDLVAKLKSDYLDNYIDLF